MICSGFTILHLVDRSTKKIYGLIFDRATLIPFQFQDTSAPLIYSQNENRIVIIRIKAPIFAGDQFAFEFPGVLK